MIVETDNIPKINSLRIGYKRRSMVTQLKTFINKLKPYNPNLKYCNETVTLEDYENFRLNVKSKVNEMFTILRSLQTAYDKRDFTYFSTSDKKVTKDMIQTYIQSYLDIYKKFEDVKDFLIF